MSNSSPESLPRVDNLTSTNGQSEHSNNRNQQLNHSRSRSPWVGIKQYTNEFSSKKASPGYIARARSIYNKLCSELNDNHTSSGYVAIEPESGEYFLNENKEIAQKEARAKHPGRLICTFQLTGVS
ncbi:MAG: hypothetical protein HC836_48750 [Richelia sp. RM2_1_2]|nr:hypothetical protein [Richelia sp. SM2_1_7]NJM20910.1 hypothetical protein [Richelia sp. SM1_7_0]NJN13374.1 hypothetical protein [Richelia sp. RM1_1_1]NJO31376.1 hypothetical protein [Richelia sp. SL_2_1]NJO65694.1 hypothetical protein [Richelia sp. RM2_1_2]